MTASKDLRAAAALVPTVRAATAHIILKAMAIWMTSSVIFSAICSAAGIPVRAEVSEVISQVSIPEVRAFTAAVTAPADKISAGKAPMLMRKFRSALMMRLLAAIKSSVFRMLPAGLPHFRYIFLKVSKMARVSA